MRLIDADALLEAIYKIYGAKHAPHGIINLITNAPSVQREEQDKLAGWVSVPIEPTPEMIKRAFHLSQNPNALIKDIYKAMIQAAPTDKE